LQGRICKVGSERVSFNLSHWIRNRRLKIDLAEKEKETERNSAVGGLNNGGAMAGF